MSVTTLRMKTANKPKPLYTEEVVIRTMFSPQLAITYMQLNLYGKHIRANGGEAEHIEDIRVSIGFPGEEIDVENADIEDHLVEAFLDG
jgi:hypothetical protein